MRPKIIKENGRVQTFVRSLDDRLDGGIPKNYIILVAGPAGSMKSSFTFNILYHNTYEIGTKGLYLSMEQSRGDLISQMAELGMNMGNITGLNIVDMTNMRNELMETESSFDWLTSITSIVARYKREFGCDMFALDSLDAIYSLVTFKNPRRELFHFFQKLRELQMTVFLVSEMGRGDLSFGKYGVEEFLSDGIVHLKLKELDIGQSTTVRRYISVVKMRKTKHDTDYHPFLITDGIFELVLD